MKNSMPTSREQRSSLLIFLILGFNSACSTDTRFGRWFEYRGEYNDAQHLPSAVVSKHRSSAAAFTISKDTNLQTVLSTFRIDGATLEDYFFNRDTNSLLILHRGEIVYEHHASGFDNSSIQPTYSVTKSIVGLLVDIAHNEGLIGSLDDSVSKYITGLSSEFDEVTIRHCLNMVSGMALNKTKFAGIPTPWNDDVKEYYDPDLRGLVSQMSIADKPNSSFTYNSYNQVLLGLVLEAVTGKDLASYASEKLWKPIGMEFDARWSIDSEQNGFAKPGSGFNAAAIDLLRLGHAILTESKAIPAASLKRTMQPCCVQPDWSLSPDLPPEEAKDAPEFASYLSSVRYSNGWWGVETSERYDIYANGHFGQFIYLSPQAELVIVRLGASHGGADDAEFGFHFYRIASAVIDARFPVKHEIKNQTLKLPR